MTLLAGKTVLVTGGGSGIGRATSIAAAREGATLIVADINSDAAEETAEEIRHAGGFADAAGLDISDAAAVEGLFNSLELERKRIDCAFNNAGINSAAAGANMKLADVSPEAWARMMNVNLTGTFLCIQQAFKLMKEQDPRGGRIINNGSISAYAPRPFSAPYTATKHGVSGLTRSAALDGRRYDIAVGQIDIGNAATEMTARMKKGVPQANGEMAVEPTMDVQHVANSVVYMASVPLDANILFHTVMATKMPFVGRG